MFPPPPKRNRDWTLAEVEALRAQTTPPPPPPPVAHVPLFKPSPEASGKLTEDETAFILRTTLRPEQHEDPNILKFIMEYLLCRSTSQAARASGLTSTQGRKLRMNPHIHHAIQSLTEKAVMKHGYDQSEIIERVKEIAGLDPIEFENPDGSYKTHMSMIAPEARRAVKSFKVKNIWGEDPNGMKIVTGQLISVELWDKLKCIEFLGREKDLFKETKKVELGVTSDMASLLLESKRRGEQRAIQGAIDVTPTYIEAPEATRDITTKEVMDGITKDELTDNTEA